MSFVKFVQLVFLISLILSLSVGMSLLLRGVFPYPRVQVARTEKRILGTFELFLGVWPKIMGNEG